MINEKQYVLFIKKHIIFPYNQLIIDIVGNLEKLVIDKAISENNGQILLVFSNKKKDKLLPKIGVVASINKKFIIDEKRYQITLLGLDRVLIENRNIDENLDYINVNVKKNEIISVDEATKIALINNLKTKLNTLIEYKILGNSVIHVIENSTSLSKIADVTAGFLPLFYNKKIDLLNELNSVKRMELLIEEISLLIKSYEIEMNIDSKLNENFIKSQQEAIFREKIKYLKSELGELSTKESIVEDYKKKTLEIFAPKHIKDRLKKEINKYDSFTTSTPEIDVVTNYIDTLLSIPYIRSDKSNNNINNIIQILDNNHYGLEKVKERILEYVIVSSKSKSIKKPIICLTGPPGVGKTSFCISIAKALKKEFVKISVGGLVDTAEIVGHRKTYLGAVPGRIIQNMQKVKYNDPVFLIDEIDKMGFSQNGDPSSCFLEILDYEQNKTFKDNFIEESYDLSNVTFITTANNINKIPYPLLDRMEIIELSSYTLSEKVEICKKHLIKKVMKEHAFKEYNLVYTTDMLEYIINHYTKEAGIRELERVIAAIIRKIIVDMNRKKNFNKYYLNHKLVLKLLGAPIYDYNKIIEPKIGSVNAMVWTSLGGDILPIETVKYQVKEEVILTGQLGSVMEESVDCAYSYIKSNAKMFGIDEKEFIDNTIHIHFPAGAIKKDGPSAGSAITTSLISLFKKIEVSNTIALTGEITITGRILKIGGLKEKVLGALRSGIKTVFIPKSNLSDLEEISVLVNNQIEFITVDNYSEIYDYIFLNNKKYKENK